MVVGTSRPREAERELEPYTYRRNQYPQKGRQVVVVSEQDARKSAEHYCLWYAQLTKVVKDRGWEISREDRMPVRKATLHGKAEYHELEWRFDAALGRYVITLSVLSTKNGAPANGSMRRRLIRRNRREESFLGLLVPTPEEGADGRLFSCLAAALEGEIPCPDVNAAAHWGEPLGSLANGGVEWVSTYTARAIIPRRDRDREQRISLSAQEGGVQISSIVAPLNELEHRTEWGGAPTVENIRAWALQSTNELALGHLKVHERDGLVFGIHVLHGGMSDNSRKQLINEVAWRADAWEAALTGADLR